MGNLSKWKKFRKFSGQWEGLAGTIDMNKKQSLQILDKNGYRVVIVPSVDGCTASFPIRVEHPILEFSHLVFEFKGSGVSCTLIDERGQEISTIEFICPPYAQRAIPVYYVMRWCAIIGYEFEAVKFSRKGEEINEQDFFAKFISRYQNKKDMPLETNLITLCSQSMQSMFTDAQAEEMATKLGILDGYDVVKNIFVSESLLEAYRKETEE